MITPITRKELYLAKIIGEDVDIPETAKTREELFFLKILDNSSKIPEPITREELFLAKVAGQDVELPEPKTRLEHFLARAAGVDITVPVPITREEMFWADYALIELNGIPPLTFKGKGKDLKNYRIYGNTVNGENVGDLITEGEHAGEYEVPVTVEGKNLAKNNYAGSSAMFTVEEVNNFIRVSGTNNSGSVKAYKISTENVFPAGSYDIVNNSDTTIGYDYRDENDALVYAVVNANSIKTFDFPAVITRYLTIYKSVPNGESIDYHFQIMVVRHGTDASTYEPYHEPITTPIYIPEQIKKVGDEAEYVDYKEQKQYFADGTSINVTLPALPTLPGTNVLSVGTAVQPSKVYIKYKGERQ